MRCRPTHTCEAAALANGNRARPCYDGARRPPHATLPSPAPRVQAKASFPRVPPGACECDLEHAQGSLSRAAGGEEGAARLLPSCAALLGTSPPPRQRGQGTASAGNCPVLLGLQALTSS